MPKSLTLARFGVVSMLCLAAAIVYLSRNCLGVAVADKQILLDLDVTKKQIGFVMGFGFFFCYSICQVTAGWLGQVIGSRRILTLIVLCSSVLTALMGVSTALIGIMVIYLAIGMIQAGIFPCSARVARDWIPSKFLGLVGGSLGSFMSVGGALASVLCGVLLAVTTWRIVFMLFAVPGIIWAVCFYLWFRNTPEEYSFARGMEEPGKEEAPIEKARLSIPVVAMLTTPAMWFLCGQQFFRAAGYIFYSTWFPTFLKETKGVTTAEAGGLSSLPMLAVVVSALAGGAFVDFIQAITKSKRISRTAIAVFCMLSSVVCIWLSYYTETALAAVLLISAGSFFASFAGPCYYVAALDIAGKDTAVVYGVTNMSGNFGAALFPVVVPWVVDSYGWNGVLVLFAGIYVCCAICWVFLNPYSTLTDEKEHKDET